MAQQYKLKDLSSLSLKDGDKIEYEVEGLDEGKVLLTKVGGKVHAVSPKCTHYGAPLKNGVLTADGRLTCPWHGACFNVTTGDVEDAPALDPLATFDVVEKDGAVYIKGDEATLKASRRVHKPKCQVQGSEKVVIVGGGSGATGVVEELRKQGFKGAITMVTKEPYLPIDRPKLSKALIPDASKVEWRNAEWFKDAGVDVVHTEVTGVDFNGKKVSTKDGKNFDYTKLVLASGADPKSLPLSGLKAGELKNVFLLRGINDSKQIVEAAGEGGKKVVVVGSSFIGMEVANALAGKKNDVTVIGMEKVPMERVMGEKVGAIFRKILEKNGVKFHMGASVDKATPSKDDSSAVGAVHLKDGTELPADVVVEGVGVGPATQYLKEAGISLEKDGSLKTDETFAVTGLKDVFAVGDIATYPYHGPGGNGTPVRIEHWNVAQNQGRNVARTIANPSSKTKPFIPVFWSAVGAQLRYCGHPASGFDDVILQGDTEKPSWIAYFAKGDEVVAAASMMKDPYVMKVAELMRRGKMPSKSEIEKGADVLDINPPAEIQI